ncbi:hypothetical protein H257_14318 [Aphanomyces astaci]|uniref:Chromo domain-containing protein n=1 Tax=Aphanomyces astaci TaxID=112090 RepID=W4FU29_APHAT|nr:hypothetical protein H257_14318 [Aphanomyces astaci]ETV70153.1 hypothetical protein H257_14318 [Aphanomyces astaci]|eukprot:XP_009840384.1 hypothetical protein H257_14318 [Aphanomyces astaci]
MRPKLPRSMSRMHDVFNVDRLKHYQPKSQVCLPAYPENYFCCSTRIHLLFYTNPPGEEMYIIEKLLKKCQFNRKLEYLIKWHGQRESEATWGLMKDFNHVVDFKQLVQDLKSRRFKV